MSEHQEQVALFQWAELQKCTMPELSLLFSIPNGGHRHKATGAKMKREGVKRGVPDIFLAVARGKHFGLFIEMKFGKNKPTPEQKTWLIELTWQGYTTEVCNGFEEAKQVIEKYLDQKMTAHELYHV